eukprot:6454841-Amphidinium_carterae.1
MEPTPELKGVVALSKGTWVAGVSSDFRSPSSSGNPSLANSLVKSPVGSVACLNNKRPPLSWGVDKVKELAAVRQITLSNGIQDPRTT